MKRIAATAGVLSTLAAPTTATAHNEGCHTRSCHERVARKQCHRGDVRACIRRAAIHHRQHYQAMVRVAWCESRLNPHARNGVHAGLFQFRVAHPSTWATTPYASRSPWSAKWAALAAGWMWKVGRRAEWAC